MYLIFFKIRVQLLFIISLLLFHSLEILSSVLLFYSPSEKFIKVYLKMYNNGRNLSIKKFIEI